MRSLAWTCQSTSLLSGRMTPSDGRLLAPSYAAWVITGCAANSSSTANAISRSGWPRRLRRVRQRRAPWLPPFLRRIPGSPVLEGDLPDGKAARAELRRRPISAQALDVVNELPRLFRLDRVDIRRHRCAVQAGH